MSQRHSEKHIWSPADVLGCGVSGTVFLCRSKETGRKYAAKVLNSEAQKRPHEVRMREAEVLKRLKHPNIVELYSIEEESSLKTMVLIMELCHASLQSILEKPINHFGLSDSQFLVAIGDITSGMKYLRENDIVHRDVKPGNILGQLQDNGSYKFKLTDFGAARHMNKEDHFTSIYGTEEYLHPDIYEQAVLKKASGKKFTAAVDLWSLGCTFYQCATGKLPFRPYGKRANRHTMFEMISCKQPNVISGVQSKHGGPIDYSETLPNASRISAGLRRQVVPIIQGLLRTDCHMVTAFQQYVDGVAALMDAKVCHIFNTSSATFHTVYLPSGASFAEFQEAVRRETSICTDHQLTFHANQHVSSAKLLALHASHAAPLIVIDNLHDVKGELKVRSIPKPPSFTKETKLDVDYAVAKGYAANAFDLQVFALDAHRCCQALHNALAALGAYFIRCVVDDHSNHKLHNMRANCRAMINQSSRRHCVQLQSLVDFSDAVSIRSDVLAPSSTDSSQPCGNDVDQPSNQVASIEDLRMRLIEAVDASCRQETTTPEASGNCLRVIDAQLDRIAAVCSRFDADRSMNRALTNCDELTHSAEKTTVRESYAKLIKHVELLLRDKAACFEHFHDYRRTLFDISSQMSEAQRQLTATLDTRDDAMATEEEQLRRTSVACVDMLTQKLTVNQLREFDQCPSCEGLDSGLQSLQDMLPDLISLAETEKLMIEHAQNLMVETTDEQINTGSPHDAP